MVLVNSSNTFQSGEPQPSIGIRADLEIDITAYVCPMTFVRTRLGIDQLQPGQILAVRLRGDEPLRNVPRTAAEQGHDVLSIEAVGDGISLVMIRKKS